MQNHLDNFACGDENMVFRLSVLSVIGDREEQQDSVGFELRPDEGMVVIGDGMGGHEGGATASAIAVDQMLKEYAMEYPCRDARQMLIAAAECADEKISSLTHDDGSPMRSGSTLAAVYIRGNKMDLISVGDSRIYLYQDGNSVRLTEDHIYQSLLNEKYENGEIDLEIYETEMRRGDALISFLGIGGLTRMNVTDKPLILNKNDMILLMTDGLYKLISEEEIVRILMNFSSMDDALRVLDLKAAKAAKKSEVSRDNMTMALLRIK